MDSGFYFVLTAQQGSFQRTAYDNALIDLSLTPSFSAHVVVRTDECDGLCADGFAFVVTQGPADFIGPGGGSLSVLNPPDYGSSQFGYVAVGVRTYTNSQIVLYTGKSKSESDNFANYPFSYNYGGVTLQRVWISYDGAASRLQVWGSINSDVRPSVPLIDLTDTTLFHNQLGSAVTTGNGELTGSLWRVGITGSTGGISSRQLLVKYDLVTCESEMFVNGMCSLNHCCPGGYSGRECDQCTAGFGLDCGTLCSECNPNGSTCVAGVNGSCACNIGFAGAFCHVCAEGYFGPSCRSCSQCAHGTCANGTCGCDAGWSGDLCNVCAPGYSPNNIWNTYADNWLDWPLSFNGGAQLLNDSTGLQLTDGLQGEITAASVYGSNGIYVPPRSSMWATAHVFIDSCTGENYYCADGFTFVLQTDGPNWLGDFGGNLGMFPPGGTNITFNYTAIAIRTYVYDTINVYQYPSSTPDTPLTAATLPSPFYLTFESDLFLRIEYDGLSMTLRVYINNTDDHHYPIIELFDFVLAPGAPGENDILPYYVGFTAGQASGRERVHILHAHVEFCGNISLANDGTCGVSMCCPGGLTGPACEQCGPLGFGPTCALCSTYCPASRGECISGFEGACNCTGNFAGNLCADCADGVSYGATCTSSCNDCVHGVCTSGIAGACLCSDGFTGTNCDECQADHYGPTCAPCSDCNGTCTTGISGTCTCFNEALAAPVCVDCLPGQYSVDCLSCTACHGTCVPGVAGMCICGKNFTGAFCNECQEGNYGIDCTLSCITCQQHGQCITGTRGSCLCNSYYSGPECAGTVTLDEAGAAVAAENPNPPANPARGGRYMACEANSLPQCFRAARA